MNAKSSIKVSFGGVLVLLTLLPGCWGGEGEKAVKQSDNAQSKEEKQIVGDVIVSMDGKPIITKQMVEIQKERAIKSNPQFKVMMAAASPEQVNQFVAQNMIGEKIIERYIADEKIDQTAAYQDDLAALESAVQQAINIKHFGQKFAATVSEADLKDFYEKNKAMLILSPGGITASAVQFDNEPAARTFMATVKQQKNDLKKAAQEAGLADKVKDFKSVNPRTPGIDPLLRDKIVAIKQVPSVELFTVNGVSWVVNATAKEEAQYRAFDQVKEGIKQQLEQTKQAEVLSQQVDKLKKQYNVELNKEYFKELEMGPEDEEALEEMLQQEK